MESEKRYQVPDGVLMAALLAAGLQDYCRDDQDSVVRAVEAAISWLDGELDAMLRDGRDQCPDGVRPSSWLAGYKAAVASVRRMFVAPPEVPERHESEVFSNKYGTTKAVVCSCGFAITYAVLATDADEIGMEFFRKRHGARRL